MRKPEITYRQMERTDEDLRLIQDCFERNGYPRDIAEIRWQYFDNPVGKIYADYAVISTDQGTHLAGMCGTRPVVFKFGEELIIASQSIDGMIDARFRGIGLYPELAASVYKQSLNAGIGLTYGFPNNVSAYMFFNKLGWTSLDPLPLMMRPLRARYFLSRLKVPRVLLKVIPNPPLLRLTTTQLDPSSEIRVLLEFDEQYDDLWKRFSENILIAVERDSKYMNWRLKRPSVLYKTLGLYVDGTLQVAVTYCLELKHGGYIGYIIELLHTPEFEAEATLVLQEALKDLSAKKCDAVLAWNLSHSPNHSTFQKSGFFNVPERIRPIQLHHGVRRFAEHGNIALGNRRNWYISYVDSDTV